MTGGVEEEAALFVEAGVVVPSGADVVAVGCVCAGWYIGGTMVYMGGGGDVIN